MILWRISNYADLLGIGGITVDGRWHHVGVPVVYLATSPASAMLEVLVHFELDADEVPDTFQLLQVTVPDDLLVEDLDAAKLPDDWRRQKDLTQGLGSAWLARRSAALLAVPSAVAPETTNYLLNPGHPDAARIEIASARAWPWDDRLLRLD